MVRKSKRKVGKTLEQEVNESSDEEMFTPSRAKKRKVLSDSEDDDQDEDKFLTSGVDDKKPSLKKSKIRRCLDSSDEENVDSNVGEIKTPKAEREKKLQELRRKVKNKKGLYSSGDESDVNDDDCPDESDEEDLPMFQHEDVLPEEAESDDDPDNDLDGFVVDDNVVEMEQGNESEEESEEEEEVKQKKRKSKRIKKQKKEKAAEEDGDSENDNYDYANPYKEMNDQFEDTDIMEVLSKKTAKDRKNAKLYKKEMGKYQFSVRSENNKAAKVSNKVRYATNMDLVKTDRGFKNERNLDVKDAEFYDYVETCLYGESVRIFPHTKRKSKYSVKCGLIGCSEFFTIDETKIVGATKFSDINLQYMKKTNKFGKESYYYICYKHLPNEDDSSDEYQSDIE